MNDQCIINVYIEVKSPIKFSTLLHVRKTTWLTYINVLGVTSDSEENELLDVEFMPDNPEDLKKAFRFLYNKLHRNIYLYNRLVLKC